MKKMSKNNCRKPTSGCLIFTGFFNYNLFWIFVFKIKKKCKSSRATKRKEH